MLRRTRRLVALSFCILVAPLVLEAQESRSSYELPRIDRDMLVFTGPDHFEAVMSDLIRNQELEDEAGGRPEDDREAPVFQDFALSVGFESLLMSIEADVARLDETGGVSEYDDPDDHQIPDPFFQGLLNPQGEVQVGSTIYRYEPHGHYEIDATRDDILSSLRQGIAVKGDEGATFTEYAAKSSCCRTDYSKVEYATYASGSRRIKAKQWVGNWALYASVGGKTKHQKKGFLGWWWSEKADQIGVRGSLGRADACVTPWDLYFEKEHTNDAAVTKIADFTLNASGFPIYVKDYFDTTHWASDNGGSVMHTLSMCDCREAYASFTLPTLSNDSVNIPFDGSASQNESKYFLEIFRTNASGSNTISGNYWSSWTMGEAGPMNLGTMYNFTDVSGGTGTYYRVRLGVRNGCTHWHEQVRWIQVIDKRMHVQYRAHVKGKGWLDWQVDGTTAGTTGESRRMEAAQIQLINPNNTQICYQPHVQGLGWMGSSCDGAVAGTTGQNRRMEAIKIWLNGAPAGCSVQYRAHVKGNGWLPWVANGAVAGTTGQARRMEAVQVKLVNCP